MDDGFNFTVANGDLGEVVAKLIVLPLDVDPRDERSFIGLASDRRHGAAAAAVSLGRHDRQ